MRDMCVCVCVQVPPTWVALFNESELQMLISGRSGPGGLDLADLSAHTDYSGT